MNIFHNFCESLYKRTVTNIEKAKVLIEEGEISLDWTLWDVGPARCSGLLVTFLLEEETLVYFYIPFLK